MSRFACQVKVAEKLAPDSAGFSILDGVIVIHQEKPVNIKNHINRSIFIRPIVNG